MSDEFGLCGIIIDENPESDGYEVGACKQFCNDGPDCNKVRFNPRKRFYLVCRAMSDRASTKAATTVLKAAVPHSPLLLPSLHFFSQ
jgi:hypothetical protein